MRKKRRFALQAVLDYRRHVENEAQRAVAERGSALESLKRRIDDCEEAAIAYMRFVRADGTLRLADVHACEKQLAALQRRANCLAASAEECLGNLNIGRSNAVEASRDRRAIESLRDRHLAELAVEERRAEEQEIAEAGSRNDRRAPRCSVQDDVAGYDDGVGDGLGDGDGEPDDAGDGEGVGVEPGGYW